MAKLTQREKIIEILTDIGSKRVEKTQVRRYDVMTDPEAPGTFYYVGNNGALRRGTIATESLSVPSRATRFLNAWRAKHRDDR